MGEIGTSTSLFCKLAIFSPPSSNHSWSRLRPRVLGVTQRMAGHLFGDPSHPANSRASRRHRREANPRATFHLWQMRWWLLRALVKVEAPADRRKPALELLDGIGSGQLDGLVVMLWSLSFTQAFHVFVGRGAVLPPSGSAVRERIFLQGEAFVPREADWHRNAGSSLAAEWAACPMPQPTGVPACLRKCAISASLGRAVSNNVKWGAWMESEKLGPSPRTVQQPWPLAPVAQRPSP